MTYPSETLRILVSAYFLLWGYAAGLNLVSLLLSIILRKSEVVSVLITAATEQLISWMLNWRLLVGAICVGVIFSISGHTDWFRPVDKTWERHLSELLAAYAYLGWLVLLGDKGGTEALKISLGSSVLANEAKTNIFRVRLGLGFLAGVWIFLYPGPCGLFGMGGVLVYWLAFNLFAFRAWAGVRRAVAPISTDISLDAPAGAISLLLVSDTHLTSGGALCADGSVGGNANLARLCQNLRDESRPSYLVVNGDLVDHGIEEEWREAAAQLEILRKTGVRILLSPGNHDLTVAYDPISAYGYLRFNTAVRRSVDTSRLVKYLLVASRLEPDLQTHDGQNVKDIVAHEIAPVLSLVSNWQAAVQRAAEAFEPHLRQMPQPARALVTFNIRRRPPNVLRYLEFFDPEESSSLVNPLLDQALAAFSPPQFSGSREDWREAFTQSARCELPAALYDRKWTWLWEGVFPLRLRIAEAGIEFVIVNSTPREPGLIGSAIGRLGQSQEERLRCCIKQTQASAVVLLMHHAICAWKQAELDSIESFRIDLNHWGVLAHDSDEGGRLPRLLCEAAPSTCKQILLCSGHRHSLSRAGSIVKIYGEPAAKGLNRLLVAESAALPDVEHGTAPVSARQSQLLSFEYTKDGAFRPSRVAWASLFG